MSPSLPTSAAEAAESWRAIVARYHRSDDRRAWIQVLNSFLPYLGLWILMVLAAQVSLWLVVPLAMVAAGFLVRIFIILHDCGHGSFFTSKRANRVIGFLAGILTFTPFEYWAHRHSIHHATSGNLDKRGVGDVWTMTLDEYRSAPRGTRIWFRIYRNPIVLFLVGPVLLMAYQHRVVRSGEDFRWHRSVIANNLVILALAVAVSLLIGVKEYLVIQLLVTWISGAAGIWLFYVQHQFEGVYWERQVDWDYLKAALKGSSYYRLPRVLQWFSGNIGFHHIHHLSPRIPNYLLDRCHRENPLFQKVKVLGLRESLRTVRFRVWDEERGALVGLGPFWI